MGAVVNYRRSIGAAEKPLTAQFLHDSRTDVFKYDGRQVLIRVGSGDPYRNADVTVNFAARNTGMEFSFSVTSGGKPDEFVSLHGVLSTNVQMQVYLNGALVAEYYTGESYSALSAAVQYIDRGTFYQHDGDFASPFLRVQPVRGLNTLRLVLLPAPNDDGRNFFWDGAGLNLRGGPKA